jgi:hypothetical protein
MTTLTVEIDKDEDLSDLKEFINRLGLRYHVDDSIYTEQVKAMLDERCDDYRYNKVEMVSSEDSQKRIEALLANQSK